MDSSRSLIGLEGFEENLYDMALGCIAPAICAIMVSLALTNLNEAIPVE